VNAAVDMTRRSFYPGGTGKHGGIGGEELSLIGVRFFSICMVPSIKEGTSVAAAA
jgi:hypothetical protein